MNRQNSLTEHTGVRFAKGGATRCVTLDLVSSYENLQDIGVRVFFLKGGALWDTLENFRLTELESSSRSYKKRNSIYRISSTSMGIRQRQEYIYSQHSRWVLHNFILESSKLIEVQFFGVLHFQPYSWFLSSLIYFYISSFSHCLICIELKGFWLIEATT